MKFKLKAILITLFATLLALVGLGYVFVIGFVSSTYVKDGVFTVHSENPLSRIGANVVAFNTGTNWVLVDTHLGPLAGGAKAEIENIANQPVALAFNSHWHPDHSGGNATFTDEADIVAHSNALALLSAPHAATGLTAPGSTHSYKQSLPPVCRKSSLNSAPAIPLTVKTSSLFMPRRLIRTVTCLFLPPILTLSRSAIWSGLAASLS